MAIHSLHTSSAVIKALVPGAPSTVYSYGFEVAGILDGWAAFGTGSVLERLSYSGVQVHSGAASVSLSGSGGTTSVSARRVFTGLAIGNTYTFTAWVVGESGG